MPSVLRTLIWISIALLGAGAFAVLALARGEGVSAAWVLVAALCTYAIGQRFYARFISQKIFALDDRRPTPAVRLEDGHDFIPTNRWVVFGHHFAAIAGAGPLVGPILAAQFGFLPGTLWIVVGVVLGGAVQDFVILCGSLRRDGRSLARMASDEIGPVAGIIALLSIVGIILILIAFLSLVVVNALAESPWGTVTIGLTIPIALIMGVWMRFIRPGRVLEASLIGLVLMVIALFTGQWVAHHAPLAAMFTLSPRALGWAVIIYGFVAAALPVWLLLTPRDYLSSFVKVGTVAMLAVGIFVVLPHLHMPAINPLCIGDGAWADGTGKVVAGTLFPFCFITIACGAISGFHALVSSGTTPKMLARESHAPAIGYGAMLLESFVAILALIAACSLHPGVYFAMNAAEVKAYAGDLPHVCTTINGWIGSWSTPIAPEELQRITNDVGTTIVGRTGGAPTLAVGMAEIFHKLFSGGMALWYHFAIMFEALFILTTVDAGTRVGRFLVQEALGKIWKPLGVLTWWPGIMLGSAVIVGGWGYFLLTAIADPTGGVRALVPLFGVANQLLAAVALAVGTVILVRMGKAKAAWVTLIPLAWLTTVTLYAGWNLIFSANPGLGLLAGAEKMSHDIAAGTLDATKGLALITAKKINAVLCGIFMTVIVIMLTLAARACLRILIGKEPLRPDLPLPAAP